MVLGAINFGPHMNYHELGPLILLTMVTKLVALIPSVSIHKIRYNPKHNTIQNEKIKQDTKSVSGWWVRK